MEGIRDLYNLIAIITALILNLYNSILNAIFLIDIFLFYLTHQP